MPLNYIKAFHVLIYGCMSFLFLRRNILDWNLDRLNYAKVLVFIYLSTAFTQACLTIFAKQYATFAIYFFLSSTLVLFLAYVLNYRPELLNKLQKKYLGSSLNEADCQRITKKIKAFLQDHLQVVSRNLTLDQMCKKIGEKKHHVSQSISQEFKTSFNDLVNFQRIEYAKSILRDPTKDDLKILAVAIESGFNNKNTFNRAFTKFTNQTPSSFRAQNRYQIIIFYLIINELIYNFLLRS
jgi:AraC-like DNA-binding protein